MRISDLSSDVCSSDLAEAQIDLDHQTRADIAAAFQLAAGDVLADRTINAMHMAEGLIGVATRRLVVAGGVASNLTLRARLETAASSHGYTLIEIGREASREGVCQCV